MLIKGLHVDMNDGVGFFTNRNKLKDAVWLHVNCKQLAFETCLNDKLKQYLRTCNCSSTSNSKIFNPIIFKLFWGNQPTITTDCCNYSSSIRFGVSFQLPPYYPFVFNQQVYSYQHLRFANYIKTVLIGCSQRLTTYYIWLKSLYIL